MLSVIDSSIRLPQGEHSQCEASPERDHGALRAFGVDPVFERQPEDRCSSVNVAVNIDPNSTSNADDKMTLGSESS